MQMIFSQDSSLDSMTPFCLVFISVYTQFIATVIKKYISEWHSICQLKRPVRLRITCVYFLYVLSLCLYEHARTAACGCSSYYVTTHSLEVLDQKYNV